MKGPLVVWKNIYMLHFHQGVCEWTLCHFVPHPSAGGYVDHPVQHGCGRLQTDATHGQGPWKYLELFLIYIQTEQSHDDMKCIFFLVFEAAKSVNKPWAPIQMLHPTSQRLWTHVDIFSDTRRQQSCVLCTSPKWISWGSQCGGVPTAVMKVTSAKWPLHASLCLILMELESIESNMYCTTSNNTI